MKHKPLYGVAFSALLFAIPAQAQSTFPDVPDNHWAAAAVKKLAEAGIVEGFSNAPVQRAASEKDVAAKVAVNATPVQTTLMNNAALAGARIDVDSWTPTNATQGIIALRGTVKNAAQKKLAEAIAKKSAPGIRIVNHLKIVAPKSAKSKVSKPQQMVKRAT